MNFLNDIISFFNRKNETIALQKKIIDSLRSQLKEEQEEIALYELVHENDSKMISGLSALILKSNIMKEGLFKPCLN